MREVWDAAAASGSDRVLGRPDAARAQLERLLEQLGAEPRGRGTCVEVGCGAGRMTVELAERWPAVIATDISPTMIARAQDRVRTANVSFVVTDGGLEGVRDAIADTVVCFGVVQHLPTRSHVRRMLGEIARVLAERGEAFVQLPVLRGGARARAWRIARSAAGRVPRHRDFVDAPEYRGVRLTAHELAADLDAARLRTVAEVRDHDPTLYSTYPHADDVRLRLARA
jgi:SAM-dependent methyltransferase